MNEGDGVISKWIGKYKQFAEQDWEPAELEGFLPEDAAVRFAENFCEKYKLDPDSFQIFVRIEEQEYYLSGASEENDEGEEQVEFCIAETP